MKIAIIGTGVYGIAIQKILDRGDNDIVMWTEKEDVSSIEVCSNTVVTRSYQEAVDGASIVFILTGAKFVESVLLEIKPYISREAIVVLGSKGLLEDGSTPFYQASKILNNTCCVLSGPTFAKDIINDDPVGFTLASLSKENFTQVKDLFKGAYLEYSSDLLGISLLGSLKNVYAIGSGILSGSGYGFSTNVLFITRVLDEIEDILPKLGGKKESVGTLAGLGDIMLTCSSSSSRNYSFGAILANGNEAEIEKFLSSNTVEGIENLKTFHEILNSKKIDAPLLDAIYKVFSSEKDATTFVDLIAY